MNNLIAFDKFYYNKGLRFVSGVDEAGRGPLAGPVVAAAVILSEEIIIDEVNDSKKLTPKKREILFDKIKTQSLSYGIGIVDNEIIDKINILQATFLAMKQASSKLKIKPDIVLVDGNHKIPGLEIKQESIIGGDAKSQVIACASILAKVTRDNLMLEYAKQYPQYLFEKHKGYGTKAHIEAIKKFGACPIHRKTFAPVSDIEYDLFKM